MKIVKVIAIFLTLIMILCSCTKNNEQDNITEIALSDNGVTVDGKDADTDFADAVYVANDIIYYESGKDFTYGEGSEKDAHTKEDADAHTVVHISKPGTYSLSGKLSKGQIAIDLGEDAKENVDAVVTLILNGVDITCEVAPAVIFYNVFECGNTDTEKATKDIDTKNAGANVIIADDTHNNVSGSYVEKIYKPDSVVLNDDNTEVKEAKKLHKYDGAFYSKMSINVTGEEKNTGILNIKAENEGLDSELHLTVNGGNINIISGNDGINTNEDGVSVTTINGGELKIRVTGETGEGDGIDSNGWLVINGGSVDAQACSFSADTGIDSDMGIHINGGTVIATGHMLDRIEDGSETYAVFNFTEKQTESNLLSLKDVNGNELLSYMAENDFSVLIYADPELTEGTYRLFCGEKQLEAQAGEIFGGGMKPGMKPQDTERPEDASRPDFHGNGEYPEGSMYPQMPSRPEDDSSEHPFAEIPSGEFPTDDFHGGELPTGVFPDEENSRPERPHENMGSGSFSDEFQIKNGANMFIVR